jgi:hypothetical protein
MPSESRRQKKIFPEERGFIGAGTRRGEGWKARKNVGILNHASTSPVRRFYR